MRQLRKHRCGIEIITYLNISLLLHAIYQSATFCSFLFASIAEVRLRCHPPDSRARLAKLLVPSRALSKAQTGGLPKPGICQFPNYKVIEKRNTGRESL